MVYHTDISEQKLKILKQDNISVVLVDSILLQEWAKDIKVAHFHKQPSVKPFYWNIMLRTFVAVQLWVI